jgi:LmbE family N-acetylglucosaminyl deacetylase
MPDDSLDTMLLDDPAGIQRILIVATHPDAIDFGAAGSVAVWTGLGIQMAYCIVTDGDAGGSDRSISRADLAALRREEQRAPAAEVGVTDVRFLGHPDGRLVPTMELRRDLSREIRRFRPQRLVCPPQNAAGNLSTSATPTTWRSARPRYAPCTPTRAIR